MRFSKKTVAMIMALPLAFGSASAFAFGGGHGGHGGKGGYDGHGCMMGGKKMFRQLDLTDAQKDQLKQMREDMRANKGNRTEKMKATQANHQKMQQLLLADKLDEGAVRALAQEMANQQVEKRVSMAQNMHQMYSVLTPEQKTKLQELQSEQQQKCQEKMEKRLRNARTKLKSPSDFLYSPIYGAVCI